MLQRTFLLGLALLGFAATSAATPSFGSPPSPPVEDSKGTLRMAADYDAQREALQSALGDKVFVASYKVLLNDDGHLSTFSIWTDSVPTVLPKTDFVWLQDAKMTKWFVVPWSDLEAAVGQLPELNAVEPHRYLTPANIPAVYFLGLEKSFTPPEGFPKRISSGHR